MSRLQNFSEYLHHRWFFRLIHAGALAERWSSARALQPASSRRFQDASFAPARQRASVFQLFSLGGGFASLMFACALTLPICCSALVDLTRQMFIIRAFNLFGWLSSPEDAGGMLARASWRYLSDSGSCLTRTAPLQPCVATPEAPVVQGQHEARWCFPSMWITAEIVWQFVCFSQKSAY